MQLNETFSMNKLALATGLALLVSGQQATASGFAVPELSVTGLGASNALVANTKELGAIPYNPAAMGFHEDSSVSIGALLVKPDLSVDTGDGTVESEANDLIGIPLIIAHARISEEWSLGMAVNAPFGLETEWPAGTFDDQYVDALEEALDGQPDEGPAVPTNSKLEILALSPSIANRVNDNLSLSAGLDYYWMKTVEFNSNLHDVDLGTQNFDMSGDGRGIGFNLSALYRAGDWSYGISYHSTANINIEGDIETPDAVADGFGLPSRNVVADLELPWRLQIGVRNQTTEKLALEFDITRTGWSSFDELEVKNEEYGATVFTSENQWDDANAYRFGMTYDLTSNTQLRAGYTFDETPQDDDYFSPRIPDADRHLFSVGIGHKLADGWSIEAGYMYVKFNDRSLEQTADDAHADNPTEMNGTAAVNGDYESSVQLLAFGINKTFM
jgi:long-chain fatty acid transport protein